jgi:hypothetical protein
MDPEKKKTLLYVGGAFASIIALMLYMKNKQAQTMPVMGTTSGTSGGGSSNNPTLAAEIQAATALQGQQIQAQIAAAQIAAAQGIAGLQSQTQLGVAGIQSSTAKTTAAVGAAGGIITAIGTVLKAVGIGAADVGGAGASGTFTAPWGSGNTYDNGMTKTTSNFIGSGGEPYGPQYSPPITYDANGNAHSDPIDLSGSGGAYHQGTIGGGDSGWFGGGVGTPGDTGSGVTAPGNFAPVGTPSDYGF